MPQRDVLSTVDPPTAGARPRITGYLYLLVPVLIVALLVWRRPGLGFDSAGAIAAVVGYAVLAVVVLGLEFRAGNRQARAVEAALDEHDAKLPRLPKSGLSPTEIGHLVGGEQRSLLVTVYQLRAAGALGSDPQAGARHIQKATGPLPPDAEPPARVLHAAAEDRLDLVDLHYRCERRPAGLDDATQAIHDRLENAGLYRKVDVGDRFARGMQTRYPPLFSVLGVLFAVGLSAVDGWLAVTVVLLIFFVVGAWTDGGMVWMSTARYGRSPAGDATVKAARTRTAASPAETVAVFGAEALDEHDPQLAVIVRDGKFAERPEEYLRDTDSGF
jgi:uncharacterized protein (TIGR04222 family)